MKNNPDDTFRARTLLLALSGIFSVACVLGTGSALAQPDGAEAEAKKLAEAGDALWGKGNLASACGKYRESLAVRANDVAKAGLSKCIAEAVNQFDLGREARAKGDFTNGCAHFKQSMDLDAAAGTEINLAMCLVQLDKNYSGACLAYREARRMNRNDPDASRRDQREAFIARDLSQIASNLPRLQIEVSPKPGLQVKVDGDPVNADDLATAFTVCPGDRLIEASAPGFVSKARPVRAAGTETVRVKLELEPNPQVESPAPTATANSRTPYKIAGGALVGLGVVAGAVAVGFGLDTKSKSDLFEQLCPVACEPGSLGIELNGQARQSQTVAIVTGVSGALLIAGGITLFLVAPSSPPPAPSKPTPANVTLRVGPGGASFMGSW